MSFNVEDERGGCVPPVTEECGMSSDEVRREVDAVNGEIFIESVQQIADIDLKNFSPHQIENF